MTNNNTKKELPKKEFWSIFWRSWTVYGSFNSERMEALGFLYVNNTFLYNEFGKIILRNIKKHYIDICNHLT